MLIKPTCFHIPPLHEESVARIVWESVDGAEGYELDCHFDEDFETASMGKTWSDVENEEFVWDTVQAKGRTWAEIEALPAQGLMWRNIGFENLTWREIEQKAMSWAEFQRLPVRFTIHKGPGEKIQGPDQGLTWGNIDSAQLNWDGMKNLGWTWEDFEFQPSIGRSWSQLEGRSWEAIENTGLSWRDIEHQKPYGLSWESLQGRYLPWSEVEAKGLSWQEFEHLPPDGKTHIAVMAEIPLYKKKAIFRVRAYSGDKHSDYLTSTLVDIIPVFYREDSLSLSTLAGSNYLVQLHAREIEDFKEIIMALKYDPAALKLERFVPENQTSKSDLGGKVYTGNVHEISQAPGQTRFRCTPQMRTNKEWSGLIVSVRFTALRTGSTSITLS